MKFLTKIIYFMVLLFYSTAYALSDSEYDILKENSAAFAEADKQLGITWKEVMTNLNEFEKHKLLTEQRDWIKSGWDASAKKLMSQQGLSRTQAYTLACEERIKYLRSFGDNITPSQTKNAVTIAQNNSSSKKSVPQNSSTNAISNDQNTVTVEAEGTGTTKMEAMKAAWMEAVRQGVGMFMMGSTQSVDDEITEQIVVHSRGKVDAYKILSEENKNGVWHISIQAKIDKDILRETATTTKSKKLAFDGTNDAAKNLTSSENKKTKEELVDEIIKKIPTILNLSNILTYNAKIGKVTRNNNDTIYYLESILKVDLKKFKIQSDEFEKLISQVSLQKYDVPLNIDLARLMISELKKEEYPKYNAERLYLSLSRIGAISAVNLNKHMGFGLSRSYNPSSICFYKNPSLGVCYKLDIALYRKLAKKINNKYEIKFMAETNDELDPIIGSYSTFIDYPTTPNISDGLYISPTFHIDNSVGSLLQLYLKLNLNNEQLSEVKEINGKYEITPRGN